MLAVVFFFLLFFFPSLLMKVKFGRNSLTCTDKGINCEMSRTLGINQEKKICLET